MPMTPVKHLLFRLAIAVPALALVAGPANAHRRWLLPSATVLAGQSELVSLDAAASNGLFVFEHRALPLDGLVVTGPDGQTVKPEIIGADRYRSIFDVALKAQGTYRIALVNHGVFGSYMLNGERKRFRGAAPKLPAGATDVQTIPVASRTETFVTLGAPNDTALKPTGDGLEMLPVTHPNDLVTGEPAQMRFLLDGKPASGVKVAFIKGGTRYRDHAGIENLVTNGNGEITLQAAQPGYYYLEAEPDEGQLAPGQMPKRRVSYTAVLEFLPG